MKVGGHVRFQKSFVFHNVDYGEAGSTKTDSDFAAGHSGLAVADTDLEFHSTPDAQSKYTLSAGLDSQVPAMRIKPRGRDRCALKVLNSFPNGHCGQGRLSHIFWLQTCLLNIDNLHGAACSIGSGGTFTIDLPESPMRTNMCRIDFSFAQTYWANNGC
jgi:hypothetical protein